MKGPGDLGKGESLISMSFRLPAEIPAALVRASADRKVRLERPYTQQEIVGAALMDRLTVNGYLDSNGH